MFWNGAAWIQISAPLLPRSLALGKLPLPLRLSFPICKMGVDSSTHLIHLLQELNEVMHGQGLASDQCSVYWQKLEPL